MSQKETIVPGMGGTESGYQRNCGNNNYLGNDLNGTQFPGMDGSYKSSYQRKSTKPLLGFLYSVSRVGCGEYWPLYQGSNTIGNSEDCDIVLREGTVSENHAELVIRMMKNSGDVDAAIIDQRSTNGTMINGESIKISEPKECVSGDVITIGDHYELLVIIVKAKEHGLELVKDFIQVDSDDEVVFDNNRFKPHPNFETIGAQDNDQISGGTKPM